MARLMIRTRYIHPCHSPSTETEPRPKLYVNQGRNSEMNSTPVPVSVIRCARVHRLASNAKGGMLPDDRGADPTGPGRGPGGGLW